MQIQFINVLCSKWLDKINGNTYFSCKVNVIFKDNSSKFFIIPFSYGYGEQYLNSVLELLIKENLLTDIYKNNGISQHLSAICQDNNITLIYNEYHCKKLDMIK